MNRIRVRYTSLERRFEARHREDRAHWHHTRHRAVTNLETTREDVWWHATHSTIVAAKWYWVCWATHVEITVITSHSR